MIRFSFAIPVQATFNGRGFFYGLFLDIFFGVQKGIYIFEYSLLGLVAGLIASKIYLGSWIRPVVFSFGAYIINAFINRIVISFFTGGFLFSGILFMQIILGALFTAIFMIPIHYLMCRLHRVRFMRVAHDDRIFLD